MASDTIAEVFDAQEGMDDDMFDDACELVAVLGKMKQRGLASSRQGSSPANSRPGEGGSSRAPAPAPAPATATAPGMENAI